MSKDSRGQTPLTFSSSALGHVITNPAVVMIIIQRIFIYNLGKGAQPHPGGKRSGKETKESYLIYSFMGLSFMGLRLILIPRK